MHLTQEAGTLSTWLMRWAVLLALRLSAGRGKRARAGRGNCDTLSSRGFRFSAQERSIGVGAHRARIPKRWMEQIRKGLAAYQATGQGT